MAAPLHCRSRDPVDALFTQLWFRAVQQTSNLSSAYAIGREVEADRFVARDGQVCKPRKWNYYACGRRVPYRGTNCANAVDLVERRYPGTARYFDSPLKQLLKGNDVTSEWVDAQLRSLRADVVEVLFDSAGADGDRTLTLKPPTYARIRRLVDCGCWDALVAAVLLVRLGELESAHERRLHGWMAYRAMRIRFEPCKLATELFTLIDERFSEWTYAHGGQEIEAHLPMEKVYSWVENSEWAENYYERRRAMGLGFPPGFPLPVVSARRLTPVRLAKI